MASTVNLKYESELKLPDDSSNIIARVRVNEQSTLLAVSGTTNDEADGDPNSKIPVRVSGTRKYGIIARHLVITRVVTTGTDSFRSYRKIVIFQPSLFYTFISTIDSGIEYEGLDDWILAGAISERYHLLSGLA